MRLLGITGAVTGHNWGLLLGIIGAVTDITGVCYWE